MTLKNKNLSSQNELIVPILELKPEERVNLLQKRKLINRTHFGIETQFAYQAEIQNLKINRTHFGIET